MGCVQPWVWYDAPALVASFSWLKEEAMLTEVMVMVVVAGGGDNADAAVAAAADN